MSPAGPPEPSPDRTAGAEQASSQLKLLGVCLVALRLGALSWGGFIAQVPRIERFLCTGRRSFPLDVVRSWESKAIILPGPSFINFFAIAGFAGGGLVGAFLVPLLLFLPSSVLVCALLGLSRVSMSVSTTVSGVSAFVVFALAGGMGAGAVKFVRRGSGSAWYVVSGVALAGILYLGGNPGLGLLAVLVASLLVTRLARLTPLTRGTRGTRGLVPGSEGRPSS